MLMKDNVIAIVMSKQPSLSQSQADEFVSRAEEHFLTITKRTTVPPRATWLWVDLSLAFYNDNVPSGSSGNVSSIKRGDTTIQYSEGSSELTNVQMLNKKVSSYKVGVAR